jgi:hypothetical protein
MIRPSKSILPFVISLAFGVVLQGCGDDDDSTGPGSELQVEAQAAPGHIHTFETDVTFTAKFTQDGSSVQDFLDVRTEIGPAGTDQWTKEIPMLFDGTQYTGTTKFTAAGSFDVRILGQRPGESGLFELHRWETPLSAVRSHYEAGGYRVEFETNTGDYPEHGYPTTYHFLIMEDTASPRPPVTGLVGVVIRCTQGSEVEVHSAVESPAGTYSASHIFNSAREGTAQLEFTGLDAEPGVVQIPLEVR